MGFLENTRPVKELNFITMYLSYLYQHACWSYPQQQKVGNCLLTWGGTFGRDRALAILQGVATWVYMKVKVHGVTVYFRYMYVCMPCVLLVRMNLLSHRRCSLFQDIKKIFNFKSELFITGKSSQQVKLDRIEPRNELLALESKAVKLSQFYN